MRYFEECTGASSSVLGESRHCQLWPLCEHGKVSGLNDDIVVPGDLSKIGGKTSDLLLYHLQASTCKKAFLYSIDSTPSHLGRSDAATAGHQAIVDEMVNDIFKKMSEGKATWNQWVFIRAYVLISRILRTNLG